MILAVHPDDESLSAGGLIQQALERNAAVKVIVITNGENNPWPQRFLERRWKIDGAAQRRWGRRRASEAINAAARLGLTGPQVAFWHYPDLGLSNFLLKGNPEFCEKLASEIHAWQPTLIVAPALGDLHPDHNSCALMLRLMRHFDYGQFSRPFDLLEYVTHHPRVESESAEVQLYLNPHQVARKRQAILQHRTQMALSRRRFLSFARAREEFYFPPRTGRTSGPILYAGMNSSRVRLLLAEGLERGSFFIVALHQRNSFISYRLTVSHDGAARLMHAVADETLGRGQLRRRGARMEVILPEVFFHGAILLAVKREGGWSIFDRCGWQEVLLAREQEEVVAKSTTAPPPAILAVIPCYNVVGTCATVVSEAMNQADHVVVVNDGSTDGTLEALEAVQTASEGRVTVLGWPINRGKGAALLEAFQEAAKRWPAHVVVTLDGDGQHRPKDITGVARVLIEEDCDLVMGERQARLSMPLRSRFGNGLTAALIKTFYPAAPQDTQTGFRAFAPRFLQEILAKIKPGRYETELQILLLALRQGRHLGSFTIPTVYIDDNRLSHFRPLVDSWRVYRTFFGRSFR